MVILLQSHAQGQSVSDNMNKLEKDVSRKVIIESGHFYKNSAVPRNITILNKQHDKPIDKF